MSGVLAAIRGRRSVGSLLPDPIPAETIRTLLDAAVHAPNHQLTRPWRFVVLTGAARRALGRAHAAAVAREEGGLDATRREREEARPERAPVVIVCIVRSEPGADVVVAREDRDAVAAGVQNLLLATHALGLGAIWRTGSMVDEPEVRSHLGVGPDAAIVAFVYVGIPAGRPVARPDRSADDLVEWRG